MEITMYEDGSYNNFPRENLAQMKRKFTLDLNGRSSKKIRTLGQSNFNSLLTSPDLNMLKLGSPELDQLVLQQGNLLPSGFNFPAPTKVSTPTTVTQEEFVKGFQDTLEQLHHKDNSSVITVVPSSTSTVVTTVPVSQPQYTQLEVPLLPQQQQVPVTTSFGGDDQNVFIKEEPQTVPSVCGTPPLSPIDMESQEKIKLERKRLRNRIAASKCRKRKLERISRLEDKVNLLKNENTELQTVVNRMRDQVCSLKQELMEHVNSGCQIPFISLQ
ncbi:Transcription factor AP-1 [Armadillidium nasatum]|uniref:Transcription factor AP-1 n=1 Tax=Armadillidium nasatum TaxID=96803 RepID=A0A5N5SJI4_9CRUS|nr:Transcription factor AP-1 [Armadillidium nasatum]